MTTLADKCKEWWPKMCAAGVLHTEGLTATQIYNGVTRPDLWIAVYAHVEEEQGDITPAVELVLKVIKDAASLLENGELKNRIMSFSTSDSEESKEADRLWLFNRRKNKVATKLDRALLEFILWTRKPVIQPKQIKVPFELTVGFRVDCGSNWPLARSQVYTYLRGELDEATFKGPYT